MMKSYVGRSSEMCRLKAACGSAKAYVAANTTDRMLKIMVLFSRGRSVVVQQLSSLMILLCHHVITVSLAVDSAHMHVQVV
jgi:hypothetical protein